VADFLFVDDLKYETHLLIAKEMDTSSARAALRAAQPALEKYPAFDDEAKIEAELRQAADRLGCKYAHFFGTLRVAVTGKTASPPLMTSMRVLGREKTLQRIERAITMLDRA
jgi:glutamyl-tRNA synthetase